MKTITGFAFLSLAFSCASAAQAVVIEVTLDGTFVRQINSKDKSTRRVERHGDRIYVSDWATDSVHVLSHDTGVLLHDLSSGELKKPWGVAVGSSGTVFVGNDWLDQGIARYSSAGAFLGRTDPLPGLTDESKDVAIAQNGRIFIGSWSATGGLHEIDPNGNLLDNFDTTGSARFNNYLEFHPVTGNLFSLSQANGGLNPRVRWREFSIGGSGTPALVSTFYLDHNQYYGFDFDAAGNVYVWDSIMNRLEQYSVGGTLLDSFDLGLESFDFTFRDFALNDNGNVLVSGILHFIPEPTTSALALAALCLAMSRRRSLTRKPRNAA